MGRRGESLLLCCRLSHAVMPARLSAGYLHGSRSIAGKAAEATTCCRLSHAVMPAQLSAGYQTHSRQRGTCAQGVGDCCLICCTLVCAVTPAQLSARHLYCSRLQQMVKKHARHLFDACCLLCEETKEEERGLSSTKQVQAVHVCQSGQHPGQTALLSVQSQLAAMSCNDVHYGCTSCKVVHFQVPARVSARVLFHVATV